MRALQPLLPHPQVPQVDGGVVAGGAGADHHHAAGFADEDRGRDRRFARMLHDQRRVALFAQRFPEGGTEGANALQPAGIARVVLPMGQHPPVVEVAPVDASLGAQSQAIGNLVTVGNDRHRDGADRAGDLNGHGSQAAGPAPDQRRVAFLQRLPRPAHQHAVRGGAHQHVGGRFLPVHVLGLRHALVRLHPGELGEPAVVGLVSPGAERGRIHRVDAGPNHRAVGIPETAMDDDFVTDLDPGDLRSDCVDDAGCVAAADMEVFRLALFLAGLDHVHRDAQGRPHIVVVDPGGHDVQQHFVGADLGNRDDFLLKAACRLTEPVLANQPGMHLLRHLADRRCLAHRTRPPYHSIGRYHCEPPSLTTRFIGHASYVCRGMQSGAWVWPKSEPPFGRKPSRSRGGTMPVALRAGRPRVSPSALEPGRLRECTPPEGRRHPRG